MDNNLFSAVIIGAGTLALGIFLSGGIYAAHGGDPVVVHNKFTGKPVYICFQTSFSVRCRKVEIEADLSKF